LEPTVSVFTRHHAGCPFAEDREYRKCSCPKWLYVNDQDGKRTRRSAGTRAWNKAEAKAIKVRESLDPLHQKIKRLQGEHDAARVSIPDAVDAFLKNATRRGVGDSTYKKLETVFKKQFRAWAEKSNVKYIDEITVAQLTDWRNTWTDASLAAKKKQERVRGFFGFCVRQGYVKENHSLGLDRILVDMPPTDYFTRDEYRILLGAIEKYPEREAPRLRVHMDVMRWSGLSIRDTTTLERIRLHGDSLSLHRAKTGVHVYVPLPAEVAERLRNVPPGPKPNPRYFFWSGNGLPKSAVSDWQRAYRKLFKIAALPKRCHPHMFRDTFAVENLLAGVPLDQVSKLLGHDSIRTTEKSYAPFVVARQQQLEQSVRLAHQTQGVGATPGRVVNIRTKSKKAS
jgi:integrase